MPKEIYPSSYVCDCGKESHHSENTIREIKEKSCRKPQTLIADDGEHEIKFDLGEMVAMYCAKEQIEIPAMNRSAGARGPRRARRLSPSGGRAKSKREERVAKMNGRIQKKDIAEELAQKMNTSCETAEEWMDRLFEILYESFKKGRSVTLQGFGGFYVKRKGKTMVFRFNPSQRLRLLFGWSSTYKGDG
jgi:DNA-binding protein HU-beta